MRKTSLFIALILLGLFGCKERHPPAQKIIMNALFTDGMVVQQKKAIPVWGRAEPGSKVIVNFNGERKEAIAGEQGRWSVMLSPVDAGGPFEMLVSGVHERKIKNVMAGEVWVCSGQSNMEMPVGSYGRVMNYKEEVANANYPDIRLFMVDKVLANTPQDTLIASGWQECSPETVAGFSAVGYFFGRKLHKDLKVPVGLIQSAWGGTIVEAWTSGKTLKQFPEFREEVERIASDQRSEEEKKLEFQKKKQEWPDKIEEILWGAGVTEHGFQQADYNISSWRNMKLPSVWEDYDIQVDGVVWFARDIDIPADRAGQELTLSLGKINDYDITWFNGQRVGRGIDVQDLRVYKIPAELVKKGRNRITVMVLDIGNVGGLYGPASQMALKNGQKSITLTGSWKYMIDPVKIDVHKLPEKPDQNAGVNRPTVLYNAMIHPLLPYGIRGAIWYQGESNAGRAWQYRKLFPALINDWREAWAESDFPFLFVQLANFMKVKPQPGEDAWAELREAQTQALTLPNTGMAVAIDIGDARDIHPKNKQEVGRRLALNALALVYDKGIAYSGPMYKSMKIEGNKVKIRFDHVYDGLVAKDGEPLKGFAIAGEDKKFVWADAAIDGHDIIVWSPSVKKPVAVRYAWAANPVCNLYNSAGLPAVPFRTDDWPGVTYGKE